MVYSLVEGCVVTACLSPLITHRIRQFYFTPFDLPTLSRVGLPSYLRNMKCSHGDYETQCLRSIPDYTAAYTAMSLEYVFNSLLIVRLSCYLFVCLINTILFEKYHVNCCLGECLTLWNESVAYYSLLGE